MKRIGFILLLFTSSVGFAQKYAVKTNLAYWATTTLNIGGEIALAPRMTLDMTDGVSVVVFLMVTNGSSVNTGTWKQNLESGMLT